MINRPITPLKSLRKHLFVAAVILLQFTVLAVLAAWMVRPVYRSAALIHVSPRYIGNLDDKGQEVSRNYKEYAYNQIYIMQSYEVLQDALLRLGDKAAMWNTPRGLRSIIFNWGESDPRLALENLRNDLLLELLSSSNMISVSLEDSSPDGLAETVNAVVEAYLFRIRGDMVLGSDERRENLRKRRRELQAQLRELGLSRGKLAEELGVAITDDKNDDPFRQTVESLYSAVYDAGLETVRTRVALEAEQKRVEAVSEEELQLLASSAAEKHEAVRKAYQALAEQKALLEAMVDNMKPSHPRRAKVELEINIRTNDYRILREKVIADEMRNIRREMEARLEQARLKAEQTAQVEQQLRLKLEDYQKRMYNYNTLYQQAANIQREILRVRQQLENIDDLLDKFLTEENAPGSIKLASVARYPEIPDYKNKIKISVALMFLGLIFCIGVPCLIDMLNPWVLTPLDVFQRIGSPAIACIIEGDSTLIKSYADDQIRRMVLSLDARRIHNNCHKILLTSVKSGGGSTELCFRMCKEFQKIGIRPLLVEANIFKPDPRYMAEGKSGLIDMVRDQIPFEFCLVPEDAENDLPARICAGNTRGERLLPSGLNLNECVAKMSADFDVCIFDTPPILLSADAELVARSCDAALLVVEAEGVTLKEMERAVNILEQIIESVAVVLNRAVVYRGAGYFAKLLEEYQAGNKTRPDGLLDRWFLKRKTVRR